jgi:Rrf2 family transcriptional regulator, cysteine metabolism repressor
VELSCKSEYALLALMELAEAYKLGEPLQIRQIATTHAIPDRYLEQLLANLRRAGIIRSLRGAKGGYLLARPPWQITLLEVLDCIEGVEASTEQAFTNSANTVERSVIRETWHKACQAAHTVLQNSTLKDLCEQRQAKLQLDIMYYI